MLGLEAKSLQLIVTLLVALFPLVLFLLLQFHHFLERPLRDRGWDVVFTVQILYAISVMRGSFQPEWVSYHFAKQQDVLSADDEDPPRDISIKLTGIDALDGLLENKVC